MYKKTSEEKFPTLKKYSDKAPATDKFATREIKIDYEYRSIHEPDKIVPPEQRIKGYRYGPEVVPISSDAWEAVKFTTEKGVKLLGFTDDKNILRFGCLFKLNFLLICSFVLLRSSKLINKLLFSFFQAILHLSLIHI